MIVLVLAVFLLIALTDLPRLVRGGCRRELVVYITVFTAAFSLAMLLSLGVEIPSPVKGMLKLSRNVLHIYYQP